MKRISAYSYIQLGHFQCISKCLKSFGKIFFHHFKYTPVVRRRQKCYRQNTHWNRNTNFAHGNMLSSSEFSLMFPHPKHMCVSSRWELSSVFVTWAKYILCCYCSLKSTRYTYGLECVNSMSTLRIWARTKYETLVAVCSSDGTGQKHRSQSNIRLATTMATIFFFFFMCSFFFFDNCEVKTMKCNFFQFFSIIFFFVYMIKLLQHLCVD